MSDGELMAPRIEGDGTAWSLHWEDNRFDVRLIDGMVLCDYFGAECAAPPEPLWTGWRERDRLRNAGLPALVQVGRRALPAAWRLDSWESPLPGCLVLHLAALAVPLRCTLRFEVHAPSGVLRRATRLAHCGAAGTAPVTIDGALSIWLMLRGAVTRAEYLAGANQAEAQARSLAASAGSLLMDSHTGKTGFEFQPWVALHAGSATYLCEVLWSGNWALQARIHRQATTLSGGLNERGLAHRLGAGESLDLPDALMLRAGPGLDAAVQRLHRWRRAHRPQPDRLIPVQFNSWYVCNETPDEPTLAALIPQAAALGCEVFVLDAGWFASRGGDPDENWYARVGDWEVDRRRLPAGLGAIAAQCRATGMAFGIWCEPEAVGPRAEIRRTHPEWLHHVDGRAPAADERALLNLGVPEAWEHARAMLAGLVRDSGAGWLKWDFNADLNAGGWADGLPAALTGQDPLLAHYRGLYRLQDALRTEFPQLVLEMCASGGGRMDGEILKRAHTNWLSDRAAALAKLAIHFGMQRAHPAICCNDWLIDWPPGEHSGAPGIDRRGDLPFRLRVAMLGSFGISAPIDLWSDADRAVAAAHVALYRAHVRPLLHHGDQFQLTEPPPIDGNGDWAAMWYLAPDRRRGVLFAFRLRGQAERRFALPGMPLPRWVEGEGGRIEGGEVVVTLPQIYRSALLIVSSGPVA
jgi:alpha-galactosidase